MGSVGDVPIIQFDYGAFRRFKSAVLKTDCSQDSLLLLRRRGWLYMPLVCLSNKLTYRLLYLERI
jgi:hypothetical protein